MMGNAGYTERHKKSNRKRRRNTPKHHTQAPTNRECDMHRVQYIPCFCRNIDELCSGCTGTDISNNTHTRDPPPKKKCAVHFRPPPKCTF